MAKSLNYDKRVIFPSGKQQQFLLMAKNSLGVSWPVFADKLSVHRRTFNDWKRGGYSMPFNVLKKICILSKLEMPTDIEIRDPFWYASKGARAGWLAVYKKYGRVGGDPEHRKKKWREWWEREGKFKEHSIIGVSKPIKKPGFSKELAELVGVIMGDGGISKYQISITLHHRDDKEYGEFVTKLIKKLFDVPVGTCYCEKDSVVKFIVSRVKLVRFCVDKLGLKIGDKIRQQVDIPKWIKQNKLYSIACVRGLMDTDGCIFNECHRINGKKYCYPRLSFVSASEALRLSVFSILKESGFLPKIRNNRSVHLEKRQDIITYFHLVGTNNPKHRLRYKSFVEGYG